MKIISLGQKYSSGTLALGPFSPKRHYPRLNEVAISPGRRTSRPGENSPKSILAPQNHSCLGEILSLGLNMQKTTTSTTSELTCMPHMIKIIKINTLIQ